MDNRPITGSESFSSAHGWCWSSWRLRCFQRREGASRNCGTGCVFDSKATSTKFLPTTTYLYYRRTRILLQFHSGRLGRVELEFPPNSDLRDTDSARLLVLNQMPTNSWVVLTISTPYATDMSIGRLRQLRSFDELRLQHSGLTDEGIILSLYLVNAMPQRRTFRRTADDKKFVEQREQAEATSQ